MNVNNVQSKSQAAAAAAAAVAMSARTARRNGCAAALTERHMETPRGIAIRNLKPATMTTRCSDQKQDEWGGVSDLHRERGARVTHTAKGTNVERRSHGDVQMIHNLNVQHALLQTRSGGNQQY